MYLPGDAERDGFALLECRCRGDWEAASVVLRHCDPQMTAAFLARLVCDLLEDLTDDAATAVQLLREHHHAGGAG